MFILMRRMNRIRLTLSKKIIIPSNAIEKYPSVQSFYEEDQLHIQKKWSEQCNLSEEDKTEIEKKLSSSIISLKK